MAANLYFLWKAVRENRLWTGLHECSGQVRHNVGFHLLLLTTFSKMAKNQKKYYVVWQGVKPGIYTSWEECKKQVDGFPEAKYKAFPSPETAEKAFSASYHDYKGKTATRTLPAERIALLGTPDLNSISVDAACSGNPGILEYRGVWTNTGEEIFRRGPFPLGTTNIGEFLAIVTGLAWLQSKKLSIPIYSDSNTGIKWVKMKRVNTKLERNALTEELFDKIDKALQWLHNNSYENPLLKWETEAWGEIPADFGRK